MTVQAPDFPISPRLAMPWSKASCARRASLTPRPAGDGQHRSRAFSSFTHSLSLAYADRAVAIGDGRFLAAPGVLGQLLTQMLPEPGSARSWSGRHRLFGRGPVVMGLRVDRARKFARACQGGARNKVKVVEARSTKAGERCSLRPDPGSTGRSNFSRRDRRSARDGGRLGAALLDRGLPA